MSLRFNELRNLLSNTIHIDEYKSKMGEDRDVIVFSFKIKYYDPAIEFSNFLEKGYEWILDADVSAGEMDDGSYVVFVETLRRPSFPKHLVGLLSDMNGLTGVEEDTYEFSYHKGMDYLPATVENLKSLIPLTPRNYDDVNAADDLPAEPEEDVSEELNKMRDIAGISRAPKAVVDPDLKEFVNLGRK